MVEERSLVLMKIPSIRLKRAVPADPNVISVGYKPKPSMSKATFLIVFGVLLAGASFYEGTAFQHTTDNSPTISGFTVTNSNTPNFVTGNSSQGDFAMTHVIGLVTEVSSSKIIVKDQRTGQDIAVNIDSTTQIIINDQIADASNIQKGDLAIVYKTGPHTNTASRIIIAPGMGSVDGSSTTSGLSATIPVQDLQNN